MARFDEVKHAFWREGESYGRQPPLTDDAVANAESPLGVRLPASLVELLRI